ncbi:photosynthetic complex assembly protein [Rhodobacteraceae bacterium 2376]|uniref:Photosynthetic complex assembly protein n=1 Tax=Rhabdonatronobacter sediminivivens TaxID=2743469 RepID=A0A7Z0HW37_9RHOB|nr:photosynthetic complex assembly protein PuhC [Rhabdonatronobacter sediminivivens]NYS23448.1 photosynthetic complex assembly protein [Rhabdonatronobacter sediminivivens]
MTSDPNLAPRQPAFKREDRNDMIPVGLIRGMFALALASLALVTGAVLTDRPLVAVPHAAPVTAEYRIVLIGHDAQAVTVMDEHGAVVADLPHGGFITVIENGLQRKRMLHGVPIEKPLRIVAFENGRLAALDDYTDYRVELGAFGSENRAAFERLIQKLN